jgi:hypothetical protein
MTLAHRDAVGARDLSGQGSLVIGWGEIPQLGAGLREIVDDFCQA